MFSQVFAFLSLLGLATAHFNFKYPEPRGDPFASGASEYVYPCANLSQTPTTPRTLWPLTGGSLVLDLHHPWTYYFINLGLGTDYPVFNISLTPQPRNETGNGTLCLQKVELPESVRGVVREGGNASIQVVTVGEMGSALYVCADITFSEQATVLGADECVTSEGVSNVTVAQVAASTSSGAVATTTSGTSGGSLGAESSLWRVGMVAKVGALGVSWLL